jgi:hypothetical protein
MYHAHNRSRYGRAVVAALPEVVWSEGLKRETRWSRVQLDIASAAANHPDLNQRDIAARVGVSQGFVSKTLARMRQLGVMAVSTTRGCRGSTVAWFRRGARRLAQRMIPPTTTTVSNGYISSSEGVGIIHRGPIALGAIFAQLTPTAYRGTA